MGRTARVANVGRLPSKLEDVIFELSERQLLDIVTPNPNSEFVVDICVYHHRILQCDYAPCQIERIVKKKLNKFRLYRALTLMLLSMIGHILIATKLIVDITLKGQR